MKETNISKLIGTVREQISSFGLFTNVVMLVFLKYLMEKPESIGVGSVDYKNIYQFRKLFDQAKDGKKVLQAQDFELLLDSIDFVGKATTESFFFHDLSTSYEKLFVREYSQAVLFNAINDFVLPDSLDEMKVFFETVLAASAGDVRRTGEHITNKSLRTLVAKILDVQSNDLYLDCFCGYSTMLLSLDNYCEYYGYDIDYSSFCVSVMMELMLGRKESHVVCGDFLEKDNVVLADKLFSDAPLGLRFGPGAMPSLEYYDKSKDLNVVAIYKALDSLCDGGRAVFTVPARALTSVSRGYTELRKMLAESGLKAVIELPSLWAGTVVQTNLLVVEKGYTGRVEFIAAGNAGVKTKDKSLTVLTEEDIAKIMDSYQKELNVENYSISVDRRDVICANTFAISKYMTPQSTIVDYRSVEDIDNELDELYARLHDNLRK